MFKQFIMRAAIDVVQIDAYRLCAVNEVLAVLLMATKYNLPVRAAPAARSTMVMDVVGSDPMNQG